MQKIAWLLCLALVLGSCAKRRAEKQAKKDKTIIEDYIAQKGLSAKSTDSGLYYVIDQEGTGDRPSSKSTVRVAYQGYFTSGAIFDGSSGSGIEFNLQNVIKGWTEGIPLFKEGGKGMLLIPSALAYGKQGSGNIPPNTVILFDIRLIEVL